MYRLLVDEVAALSNRHKKILLYGYQQLFQHDGPNITEMADLADVLPYVVYENNQVVALFGLDRRPGIHRLVIEGIQRYCWCIWDAFFIAEALKAQAFIETIDPISKEPLKAKFIDRQWIFSPEYWVSFPLTRGCCGESASQHDLRSAFCRFVHLFSCQEHALSYQQMQHCEIMPSSILLERSHEMANAMQPQHRRRLFA